LLAGRETQTSHQTNLVQALRNVQFVEEMRVVGSRHIVSRHDVDVPSGSNATRVMVDSCGASILDKNDKLIVAIRDFNCCRPGTFGRPAAAEPVEASR
jgi:hypothetical protein